MPKIIENLENRLIEEAARQLSESGYGALTIRSVAKGCGVGVGTVYNYFPSKDSLVASYMLEDWKVCLAAVYAVSADSQYPENVLRCMFDQLLIFAGRHQAVFQDSAAAAAFCGAFSRYHAMLRSQLAEPVRKFCSSDFMAEFIAEAMLTWTMAGKEFSQIYGMLEKCFDVPLK